MKTASFSLCRAPKPRYVGAPSRAAWGLHREQRNDLEEVVRDHVAQAAGGLVEPAATLDPNCSAGVIWTPAMSFAAPSSGRGVVIVSGVVSP
jgi:hypothetical protein